MTTTNSPHWVRNNTRGKWSLWHWFAHADTAVSVCGKTMVRCDALEYYTPRRGKVCPACEKRYTEAKGE